MSDYSLTLVLHFKTSKIFNGMAKVQIKSEKITPFGGVFHVREQFSRFVGPVIDKVLGLRCTSYDYQYSEIAGTLASFSATIHVKSIIFIWSFQIKSLFLQQ